MEAEAIADELQSEGLWTVDAARSVDGVPPEPGFYSWWSEPGAIPGVPLVPHPTEPFSLLYIGIAPSRESSGSDLRSRLVRQHMGGNVGSSTFRFGLASLLWEQQAWVPRWRGGGVRLDRDDNARLSDWQKRNLRVSWASTRRPWRAEEQVVAMMRPPMNREHGVDHPFYEEMGSARAKFRTRALLQS